VTWPAEGPKKLWDYKIGGGHSSPMVVQKRLYTQAAGNVVCLDADTGALLWKCPLGAPNAPSNYYTPAVDGKVVYGMNDMGLLLSIDADTGKQLWAVDLPKDLGVPSNGKDPVPMGSPRVLADRLILSRGLALEKATGKLVWKAASVWPNGNYVSPTAYTAGDTKGVVFYIGPKLIAVAQENGNPLWSVDLPWWAKNSYADAIALPEHIFFDGAVVRLQGEKPALVNPSQGLGASIANPAVWDGHIYASCGGWGHNPKPDSYQLKCVDAKTFTQKWSKPGIWGPLLAVDGKILVATHKGEIVAIKASPDGFQELSRAMICPGAEKDVCWATPTFADGRFYMRRGGLIVCLDLHGK
jgi:outer membrane protein assembly factor BamB